jgi:hypothetical protein
MRFIFVRFHQPAVADDVGGQYRGKTALSFKQSIVSLPGRTQRESATEHNYSTCNTKAQGALCWLNPIVTLSVAMFGRPPERRTDPDQSCTAVTSWNWSETGSLRDFDTVLIAFTYDKSEIVKAQGMQVNCRDGPAISIHRAKGRVAEGRVNCLRHFPGNPERFLRVRRSFTKIRCAATFDKIDVLPDADAEAGKSGI